MKAASCATTQDDPIVVHRAMGISYNNSGQIGAAHINVEDIGLMSSHKTWVQLTDSPNPTPFGQFFHANNLTKCRFVS